MTITHNDIDHLTKKGPPVSSPAASLHRGPLTSANIFKLVPLGPHCIGSYPPPQLVHHIARTVGKRGLGIRLKCLLLAQISVEL